MYRLERSFLNAAFAKTTVRLRALLAFCLVILGAFTSVGSLVAFGQDSTLRSQLFCGTADALQPICGQNFVSYGRIYPLAIFGVGATFVGFCITARLDRMRQTSSRF
ncbi:MAG: hypothetical protein ACRD6W_19565 [Nitrososphaerales archaeon]